MPEFHKTFKGVPGTYSGFDAARKWLRDHNIICGNHSLDRPPVIGLLVGRDHPIAKWRSLAHCETKSLDGSMTFSEPGTRGGDVMIVLTADAAARAGIHKREEPGEETSKDALDTSYDLDARQRWLAALLWNNHKQLLQSISSHLHGALGNPAERSLPMSERDQPKRQDGAEEASCRIVARPQAAGRRYLAEVSDDPRVWEAGETPEEAIGKLALRVGLAREEKGAAYFIDLGQIEKKVMAEFLTEEES